MNLSFYGYQNTKQNDPLPDGSGRQDREWRQQYQIEIKRAATGLALHSIFSQSEFLWKVIVWGHIIVVEFDASLLRGGNSMAMVKWSEDEDVVLEK